MSTKHAFSIVNRVLAVTAVAVAAYACGGTSEQAGQPCTQASECYPTIDPTKIQGDVQCLTKVPGGYCTHLCTTDADCCAVPGECLGNHPQVCAPFESTGMMMCFLSCEASDLGGVEEGAYCAQYAGDGFGCRSTGGGNKNRKICSP